MKTACVVFGLMLSLATLPAAEKTPKDPTTSGMERRFFDVLPSFLMRWQELPDAKRDTSGDNDPNGLKRVFAELGVKWPEGSSATHIPQLSKLIVVNTRENMTEMEKALVTLNVLPYLIKLEFFFVAFPTAMVAKAESGKHFAADDALKLWKDGKGRAVSTMQIVTKAACEATSKDATEWIYPTEFTVTPILTDTNNPASIVGGICEPGGFETREVGAIVSVMPEVTPDGQMIDLTLTPHYTEEPTWENYDLLVPTNAMPTKAVCRQPIFSAHSISTSTATYCGVASVVAGGWHLKRTPEVMYLIMEANLVGPDGKVLPGREAMKSAPVRP